MHTKSNTTANKAQGKEYRKSAGHLICQCFDLDEKEYMQGCNLRTLVLYIFYHKSLILITTKHKNITAINNTS